MNWRRGVIILTFLGSCSSVLALIFPHLILIIPAVLLPISIPTIMFLVKEFSDSSVWVQYRYATEHIRSNIYLYRAGAGAYTKENESEKQQLLHDTISSIKKIIKRPTPITKQLPNITEETDSDTIENIIKETVKISDKDDYLSDPITLEMYKIVRLSEQKDWYEKRRTEDYKKDRDFRFWSIIVPLIGSMIAILISQLIENSPATVAIIIANAIGIGLNSWTNTNMFGKTYAIYYHVANKLDDIFANDIKTVKELAEKVEPILIDEINSWFEMSLEALIVSDKQLVESIEDLQTKFAKTTNIPKELLPIAIPFVEDTKR